jgi:GntR family transcriptional repressor for pyruvate dehydrogenase complex
MLETLKTNSTSQNPAAKWAAAPKRKALVDHVVAEVRQAILRGDYPVGGELPAAEKLADAFGVSMTVIREAMRGLRSQGLIEVWQGRKPQVAAVDSMAAISILESTLGRAGSMEDLMQVRWVLEVEIAALAATHATEPQIAKLSQCVEEMRDGTTLERQIEADVQFHRVLAEATGNRLFPLLTRSLEEMMRELRRRTILASGVRSGLKEHSAVLKAIKSRDHQAAREAMVLHMQLADKSLRKEPPDENSL